MTNWLTEFTPARAVALERLADFAPHAAANYAKLRNFDYGMGRHAAVSTLSPYIKSRVLDERAVMRAILAIHDKSEVEKFAAEVFWRSYWKGWMELRPAVWEQYQQDLQRLKNDLATQSGLRQGVEAACLGQTGIAPFDDWAQELAATGYLHNHARMWFASIWIFTLKLPWQLGADFFLRHLLDGDAAVNTLSWRWVAGIQTVGKTYLARADNIATFTAGRYRDVPGLAQNAVAVDAPPPPAPRALPACAPLPPTERMGLLIHEDDMDAAQLLPEGTTARTTAYLDATAGHRPWHMAPHVTEFRQTLARDMTDDPDLPVLLTEQDIADWAASHDLTQIVARYAPVGPSADLFARYQSRPDALPVSFVRRALDSAAWPRATKGFFPFRKHIPALIDEHVLG